MDLVPTDLVVRRYFADDQIDVDELTAEAEAATQAVDVYAEEHGGDEGLLSDAVNDKGKLTQAAVKAALKEARASDDDETIECAEAAIEHLIAEVGAKRAAKDAQAELSAATLRKYGELTDADVQMLVLDHKWACAIRNQVIGEVNGLTLDLVARIQQLGERYNETVGQLDAELEALDSKVVRHLADMGVTK
jgi:type I restriction enzyme M protein